MKTKKTTLKGRRPELEYRTIRIPVPTVDMIDLLVIAEGFSSRADFIKYVVRAYMHKSKNLGAK